MSQSRTARTALVTVLTALAGGCGGEMSSGSIPSRDAEGATDAARPGPDQDARVDARAPVPDASDQDRDAQMDAQMDAGTDAAIDADAAGPDADTAGPDADAAGPDADVEPDAGPPPPPMWTCDVTIPAGQNGPLQVAVDAATPGQTICLGDGTWTDLELGIDHAATPSSPIRIAAETPGSVKIGGESWVGMSGRSIEVLGLVFENGSATRDAVVEFRTSSSKSCTECRLAETTIRSWDQNGESSKWVSLYGSKNTVENSWFEGKSNEGALLVVWRPDSSPNDHLVRRNYFGDRPDLGRNGAEAIRIGTSDTHDSASRTTVVENLFERMDGEIEVISNKSGSNVYARNTFRSCRGSLVLRHGRDALVERNVFLVGGVERGGGVRVIDGGHTIVNNYVEGAKASGSYFTGGIVLSGGESSGPMNGYQPVVDVTVAFNTIVGSENSIIFGGGKSDATLAPKNVTIANNLIADAVGDAVTVRHGLDTPIFGGNLFASSTGLGYTPEPGLSLIANAGLQRSGELMRPGPGSAAIDAASADAPGVTTDIDGQPRPSGARDVGADEVSTAAGSLLLLTRTDVGPRSYVP